MTMGEKTGEYIFEIVKDSDGVYCYIKQGEIVRCKDCKFYEIYPNGANGDCINRIDAFNTFYPNDYCSYGERAEE